ncbi:MAG: putative porin, partial [Verrucomicrobiota bacterium]|nr:putative porin [Verrucomicrobiota bacterium]
MKKIKILSALLTGTLASFAVGTTAMAQSSDALIDKLVEKGILNVKEANDLREEADKDFTKSYSVKSGMPDWVTALKFNGDFRGRYDGIYSRDGSDRNRLRYRMRFGATASLTDNFEVGLRLGSGQIGSAAPSLG